jgi:hypothetical protein
MVVKSKFVSVKGEQLEKGAVYGRGRRANRGRGKAGAGERIIIL